MDRSMNVPGEAGQPFGSDTGVPQVPQMLDKIDLARRLLADIGSHFGLTPLGPEGGPGLPPGVVPLEPRPDLDLGAIINALDRPRVGRRAGIRIGGVEMTQSTQFFEYGASGTGAGADNAIPLVANKELVLRVFVEIRPDAGYVPDQVTGRVRFGGREFSPLNGTLRPQEARFIRRTTLGQTLRFRIPAALCRGSRTFEVRVFDAAIQSFRGVGVFSHDAEVGVACMTKRRCLANLSCTTGCLCVA